MLKIERGNCDIDKNCKHSNKLRVESTRKNRHVSVSKKFDTQTCTNDTFACEIHVCVSIFKYICAETRSFFQNTRPNVISTHTSVISARRV
jgi:hypothetical protein